MPPEPDQPIAAGKKIIVVGAGIAGLSLALSLRKQWPDGRPPPSLTIYERESKESILGREGYSLSIRGDALSGGMQALQRMDILERMLPFSLLAASPRTGSFNIWSADWKTLLRVPTTSTSPNQENMPAGMRISRAVLRRVMIDAVCETNHIVWDRPCTQASLLSDGKTRVHFRDGSTDDCDILVVADGASSKIRAQLRPDDVLQFTGIVSISGTATFPDGEIPWPVDADWGGVVGGGGIGLFVSPVDTSRALWSLSYSSATPRDRLRQPLAEREVSSILDEALERGQVFCEPFPSLVRATDPATLMVFNAMDKQPFPHKPTSTTSVGSESESGRRAVPIFIGDANHAVSPFAGNGANMALLDGWDLAEELTRNASMETALESYDRRSMPRSASAVRQSHWAIDLLHARGVKLFVYRVLLGVVRFCMRWTRR